MSLLAQSSPAASGDQHVLQHGDQRAVVVEVGGGVRTYTIGGRDVLRGYGEQDVADGARGQTLIPWPNRLRDGRYTFAGVDYQLPISEPDKGVALHGFVRWESFTLAERDDSSVSLTHRVHAREGYPFTLDIRNTFQLGDTGLTATTTVVNRGETTLPYAVGFHPYLTVGTATIDEAELHIAAETYVATDARQLPTGHEPVAGSPYDFRSPRVIADLPIDFAFGDLARDSDGKAWLHLRNPTDGWRASFWIDEGYRYLELFTGEGLRTPRVALGVEPMSCPPNGLASGRELSLVEPGESVVTRWGLHAG